MVETLEQERESQEDDNLRERRYPQREDVDYSHYIGKLINIGFSRGALMDSPLPGVSPIGANSALGWLSYEDAEKLYLGRGASVVTGLGCICVGSLDFRKDRVGFIEIIEDD